MASISATQPGFFDDQYLGAEDLNAIITYIRTQGARSRLSDNTWGVAAGLDLLATDIGGGEFQVSVTPGVALDGHGRMVVVTEPTELPVEKLAGFESGPVKVWIRYSQNQIQGNRRGFNVCLEEDAFSRIEETFELEVGERRNVTDRQSGVTVAGALVLDAREAERASSPDAGLHCDGTVPYQELPVPADDNFWLIPLGIVDWRAATNTFAEPSDELKVLGRTFRRSWGSVTETIHAADGLIRLRARESDFDADINAACADYSPKSDDFFVCDGQLKSRELIWLEGDTRATGDVRLFDSRLEFRDEEGRDYVTRTIGGIAVEGIAPLMLDREDNGKDGSDLRVLLGQSEDGRNRFTIGPAIVTGEDLCNLQIDGDLRHVVFQDNGLVGIGTAEGIDSALFAPLTIRGRSDTVEIEDDEGETSEEEVWRVLNIEEAGGDVVWETTLWTDGTSLAINQSGEEPGTVFLADGGNVGIGTTDPGARLDVARVPVSNNSALGTNIWFRIGDSGVAGDAGRVWVEYGEENAPLLVLSDHDDPPRIQFQQTGNSEDEFAPSHVTWIGHITGQSEDLAIMGGGDIGLLTETPFTDVTIQGSLGFKNGADPLVYMTETAGLSERMVLANSPGSPQVGLKFRDQNNEFQFQSSDADDPTLHVALNQDRVGINTATPAQALDVRGSIKLGDSGELFALGAAPNFRVVAGDVTAAGALNRGTGFGVLPLGTGRYLITFLPAFAATPFVVASAVGDADTNATIETVSSNSCTVRTFDTENNGEPAGDDDARFMFIAMGVR